MKKIILILFCLCCSSKVFASNFPELVERTNNLKNIFELSSNKQLGRIKACIITAKNKNDTQSLKKWNEAASYILNEGEVYFKIHYVVSKLINKENPNSVDVITGYVDETESYKQGYKNFLGNPECFKFDNNSYYSNLSMSIGLLNMSFKQMWDTFSTIYPNKSNQVKKLIIKEHPNANLFQVTDSDKKSQYYDFYKNKNLIDKAYNFAAGVAAKCATLEMSKMIYTDGYWKQTFLEVMDKSEPITLIGWFDNHLEKYSPEIYSLVKKDKELKVDKKYYRAGNEKIKSNDCIDKQTSFAYKEMKKHLDLAKINSKLTFGLLYGIDKKRALKYNNFFKSKLPEIYKYLDIL